MKRADELIELGATCAAESNGAGMVKASAELLAFDFETVDTRFHKLGLRRRAVEAQAITCFRLFHEMHYRRIYGDAE